MRRLLKGDQRDSLLVDWFLREPSDSTVMRYEDAQRELLLRVASALAIVSIFLTLAALLLAI